MLKRHQVEVLLKAGHAHAEIARLTGVSSDHESRPTKKIAHSTPPARCLIEVSRTIVDKLLMHIGADRL